MKVWLVRAGKYGEREEFALENGLAVIGWDELPDLSKDKSREAIRELLDMSSPAASAGKVANHAGQLFTFVNRIEEGDLVALPRKSSRTIALGKVTGPYQYREGVQEMQESSPGAGRSASKHPASVSRSSRRHHPAT